MAYESQSIPDTTSVSDAISSRRGKLSTNFTFNANLRTVTINDTDFIQFLYITNITRGQVIYQPALAETSGVIAGNTITLNARTNGMADSDDLIVVYEATELNSEELADIGVTLDLTLGELLDQGLVQDSLLQELLEQGGTLDSTLAELLLQGITQDSELSELNEQGVTQDSQLEELRSIEVWQDNILKELKLQTRILTKIYQ